MKKNTLLLRRIILLILVGLSFVPYHFLNQPTEKIHSLETIVDQWIPLLPIFAVPYLLFIPFLVVTLVYLICFSKFDRMIAVAFILCLWIAYGIYWVYPTTVVRSAISATGIFSKLVLFIYMVDQPFNCFPSLHTALSVLALLFWVQLFPRVQLPMGVFVLSVMLSTLFTKQHYVADVLSGLALTLFCFRISQFFINRSASSMFQS